MSKKLLFACVLLLMASLYAKTVKVGYYKDSGNFMSGFSGADPRAGFAYEYIQTVASYAGWECEYVYGEWDALYPALLAGEIDVLSDVSRTPEREHLLLYPDYVMGQETYYLYAHDDDTSLSPGDFSTWKGKKIGLNKDYYHYNLFMDWQKRKNLDCEYIVFSGDESYYDRFEKHEFDLLLEIDTVAEPHWNPFVRIGAADFYLAVTKNRPDLLDDLNGALAEIFAMNPYYNNNLWLTYFSDTTISRTITPREEAWVAAHPKINVGCMNNDLPFAAYDEETQTAEGLVVELCSYLAEKLLGGNVTFSYVFYDDYEMILSDLKAGILDVVAPVYRDLNYAEDNGFIISQKLASMSVGYATKQETAPDSLGKIAIPRRLRMPFYVHEYYADLDVQQCLTYNDCLRAVLNGTADGAVFNVYKMRGMLSKNKKYRNLRITELPQRCEMSFLFARENRDFYSLINKLLMIIPSETVNAVMETYVLKEQGYTKKTFLQEYFVHILLASIAFIAISISLLFALRRIREDMYFDTLTHLRNRRSLNFFIEKFLHRATTKHEPFSLILFDIDDFKYLNDTYGHAFGDQVLVTAATIVKNNARRKDRTFRWGGEEFLILYRGTIADARQVAEKVRKEIAALVINYEYETIRFTVTAGVTTYKDGVTYMDLFRQVDANLYEGKRNGKNQVVGQ